MQSTHQPRRALLVGLLSVLVATAVLTPTPASAEMQNPIEAIKGLFGADTRTDDDTRDEDSDCKLAVSPPRWAHGQALRGGPVVLGVVVRGGLICWGDPVYDIEMTLGITRERTIVNKVWTRKPPGSFWHYEGNSLVMRGPDWVIPDTYWGWGQAEYTQGGVRKSTSLVISAERYMA